MTPVPTAGTARSGRWTLAAERVRHDAGPMPELIGEPGWQGGPRGRVLIEAAEWGRRASFSSFLRQHGFAAIACPGPEGCDERCSLAAGHGCAAAEQADVVVHALQSADLRNREALQALRHRLPGTPVVVEVPAPVVERRPDDYAGCIVVDTPMSNDELLEAVETALAGRP